MRPILRNNSLVLFCAAVLVCAGLRAPESSLRTNGFCSNGPVLEKAHDSQNDAPAFRRTASNPMTLHSGFAPSAHPFDMPPKMEQDPLLPRLLLLEGSSDRSFISALRPLLRPPISLR